jgi:hypothetical protein
MLYELDSIVKKFIPPITVCADISIPEKICDRIYHTTYTIICTYATTHVMIVVTGGRNRKCFVSQPTINDIISLSGLAIPDTFLRCCNIRQLCLLLAISLYTGHKDFHNLNSMTYFEH